jgi:hypothetical protein
MQAKRTQLLSLSEFILALYPVPFPLVMENPGIRDVDGHQGEPGLFMSQASDSAIGFRTDPMTVDS